MKITVIGWYGTETIGDRAIFAGLLSIFREVYNDFEIELGSLHPCYTKRTLFEDLSFYRYCSKNEDLNIRIFNSIKHIELERSISQCDLVVVGGGPLMDLNEMFMLEYAFQYANRKKKKTALLGCGWGPLKKLEIISVGQRLLKLSNLTIFRDTLSYQQCGSQNAYVAIDPSFFACDCFKQLYIDSPKRKTIVLNLRDVSLEGDHYVQGNFTRIFANLVEGISATDQSIHFVPMHNFSIGGDDRYFLSDVANLNTRNNVEVLWNPLSLYQTMEEYYNASMCVGMRFHSVALQLALNGNNYIIDYTDPNKGKIIGLLHQLNAMDFYQSRYCSLYNDPFSLDIDVHNRNCYTLDKNVIDAYKRQYVSLLKQI